MTYYDHLENIEHVSSALMHHECSRFKIEDGALYYSRDYLKSLSISDFARLSTSGYKMVSAFGRSFLIMKVADVLSEFLE